MSKERLAKILSFVFNAYSSLLWSYFLVVLLESEKIPNYIAILFLMVIMFGAEIFLFRYFGLISNLEITNRKERPLLNFASIIPMGLMIFIASTTDSTLFFSVSLIVFTSNLILGIVSTMWKLSGHMLYLSILLSIITTLFFSWYVLLLSLIILILVAWSRVVLKRHTLAQVIMATAVGIFLVLLFL